MAEPAQRASDRSRPWLGSVVWILAAPVVALLVGGLLGTARAPHAGFTTRADRVVRVEPSGSAARAGLREGDRFVDPADPYRELLSLPTGAPLTVRVERDGEPVTLTLRADAPPAQERRRRLVQSLVALVFAGLGLLVAGRRRDPSADLFAMFALAMAALLHAPLPGSNAALARAVTLIEDLSQVAIGPLLAHFFLRFPRPSPRFARGRILALYAPGLALALAALLDAVGGLGGAPRDVLPALAALYLAVTLGIAVVRFLTAYRGAGHPDRRRLGAIIVGTLIALLPIFVGLGLSLAGVAATWRLETWSPILFLGLPAGFAYAIVRYQALDLQVMLRRGLVVAVATVGLALVFGAVLLAADRALGLAADSPWILAGLAATMSLVLAAGATRLRRVMNRLVAPALDERLRDVRDYEDRLGTLLSERRVLGSLLDNVLRLFNAGRAAFYRMGGDGDRLVLVEERGDRRPGSTTVYLHPSLRTTLRDARRLLDRDEVTARVPGAIRVDVDRRLDALGLELIVPVRDGDELFGFLVLAPPRANAGYSRAERRALHRLALRAARALITARAHEDAVTRERLARDLEVARGIQQRLLPEHAPVRLETEMRAITLSCEAVGGDFYDFFELPDGRIGLAVGDVCGKGIGAALLMAGTHAALRFEAAGGADPATVLRRLNLSLLHRNEPDRFVCLFYGILAADGRSLVYANAGIEPPILASERRVWRTLNEGGLVLGVSAEAVYPEETVALTPGDRLLVHTDGVFGEPGGMEPADAVAPVSSTADLARTLLDGEATPRSMLRRLLDVSGLAGDGARDDATLLLVRVW